MVENLTLGLSDIQRINPHGEPFILLSKAILRYGDDGAIVGAEGRWDTNPGTARPESFLTDVYPHPGPLVVSQEKSGLFVARTDWAGYPGHFDVVPNVENLAEYTRYAFNDEDAVLGGFRKLRQRKIVHPDDQIEFGDPTCAEDGTLSGTISVGGNEVMSVEGLVSGKKGEKLVPPHYLIESAAQAGSLAALSIPRFQGKIALLAGLDNVSFQGVVYEGDEVVSDVTVDRMTARGGSASMRILRGRDGNEEAVGSIGKMLFVVGEKSGPEEV